MAASYQIIVLGSNEKNIKNDLEENISLKLQELGLDIQKHVGFFNAQTFANRSKKYPTVVVFFGGNEFEKKDVDAIDELVKEDVVVIPVVEDLSSFTSLVPDCLRPINGMLLSDSNGGLSAVSNTVLESLSLLRRSRRLFISYKRTESRGVAIQLYEHLHSNGFNVFIDTISIRPGEPFQEELWHQLSDTDVVLLLDTPGFLDSRWTPLELANASAMSIGILQIIWPGHTPKEKSSLCDRLYLTEKDLILSDDVEHIQLSETAVSGIAKAVESLRARSLSARYYKLVRDFGNIAEDLGFDFNIQPEKYAVLNKNGKSWAIIPTVGVPESLLYHEVAEMFEAIKSSSLSDAYLLYDHVRIRDQWQKHLEWLDNHLPIKSIRIFNSENWLKSI